MIYLFDVIGAVGDSLCTEPVLRYAIRNLKGQDVRILTNHPRLFKHLGKPMGLNWEDVGLTFADPNVKHIYNRMELMIDGKIQLHPIVGTMCPHFIHPVDFLSILMMKRVMPDEDKRIKVEFVDKTAEVEAKAGCKLSELVILHVGTGAPEKTRLFPEDYCHTLIEEMVGRGLKVAVFATNDNRGSHTHVEAGAIDLVDKLDWNEFCTLIAHAPVLVTNDSSPVHLASIFDNWIVALPTVKHPDRLIHPRKGSRYHKVFALYQKMMCEDSTDVPITNNIVTFNWTGIDPHRGEFLADPATVAKFAKIAFEGMWPGLGGINPKLGQEWGIGQEWGGVPNVNENGHDVRCMCVECGGLA